MPLIWTLRWTHLQRARNEQKYSVSKYRYLLEPPLFFFRCSRTNHPILPERWNSYYSNIQIFFQYVSIKKVVVACSFLKKLFIPSDQNTMDRTIQTACIVKHGCIVGRCRLTGRGGPGQAVYWYCWVPSTLHAILSREAGKLNTWRPPGCSGAGWTGWQRDMDPATGQVDGEGENRGLDNMRQCVGRAGSFRMVSTQLSNGESILCWMVWLYFFYRFSSMGMW